MSVQQILNSSQKEPPVKLGGDWDNRVSEVLDSDDSAVRYDSIELADPKGLRSSMTLLTLRMYIGQEQDFGTLSLLIDETALRVYEEKVRQGEQNLELALQNARMGFWDQNFQSGKVWCDNNWLNLIGEKKLSDQAMLDVWNSRLHPDDRSRVSQAYSDFYASEGDTFRAEYRIRKGQEDYIWV